MWFEFDSSGHAEVLLKLSSYCKSVLRDKPSLAKRVFRHLPENFCQLLLERQHEIVDDVAKNILSHDDDYTRRVSELTKLEYRLKEIPSPLCEELGEFS
jgi:hypothetical protein